MDERQRAAFIRLVVVCAAWALGAALVSELGVGGLGFVVPALLAAAAYMATRDLTLGGSSGPQYYRGRRIDRDRWRQ